MLTEKYNIYLKNKNALLGVFHENPQVNQPDYQFVKSMQDAVGTGFGSRKICKCVGINFYDGYRAFKSQASASPDAGPGVQEHRTR